VHDNLLIYHHRNSLPGPFSEAIMDSHVSLSDFYHEGDRKEVRGKVLPYTHQTRRWGMFSRRAFKDFMPSGKTLPSNKE